MLCIYYPLSGFRIEAIFGLPYSIKLKRKAKERTGGPNFTLRTLNNAKPYFFLNEMNTKDLPAMYSTAFWCLFVILLFFLALLRNRCYSFHRTNFIL